MKRTRRTIVVHGDGKTHFSKDALVSPVYQTATYEFADTAELIAYMEGRKEREEYGRYGNPTVRVFEEKIAVLDGAEDAVAFASGMSAITTTILSFTRAGSHVVLFDDCYRRTRQFLKGFLERFGVMHTLVPSGDLEGLQQAIRSETRLVISEVPTNPYQMVIDLERLASICRDRKVKSLIDSTFATPINLRPLEFGIDLVVHSATKYMGGHHDVLGGVLAGKRATVSLVRDLRHVLGPICDPHAAYLLDRGLKTLVLRVEQQNRTAMALATALESHPRVERVWYPGLPSHPNHEVAKRIMRGGYGGVVTFEVKGDLESASRVVDSCTIPRIAPSLGGVDSLIEQPALMSYFELSTEERQAVGIKDNLVRYAVGIEDTDELVADVLRALDR